MQNMTSTGTTGNYNVNTLVLFFILSRNVARGSWEITVAWRRWLIRRRLSKFLLYFENAYNKLPLVASKNSVHFAGPLLLYTLYGAWCVQTWISSLISTLVLLKQSIGEPYSYFSNKWYVFNCLLKFTCLLLQPPDDFLDGDDQRVADIQQKVLEEMGGDVSESDDDDDDDSDDEELAIEKKSKDNLKKQMQISK